MTDDKALLLRMNPERVHFEPPPQPWQFDPDEGRCASVLDHDHGKSQCFLRAEHKARGHAGVCAPCFHDDGQFDDGRLSWGSGAQQ